MARKTPCTICGKMTWRSIATKTWTPPPKVCRNCRAAASASSSDPRSPCITCGKPSYGERCRPCADASHGPRSNEARKLLNSRRADRDRQAPGPYTSWKRKHLLTKWKKQCRLCAYCTDAPVETVDHVVPLALGGTNYEGNLAPACLDCNRLKQDNLLSAWRYGIRVRKWRVPVEPRMPKPRVKRHRVTVQTEMQVCPVCGALHVRQKYCSAQCSLEGNARRNRDRYRAMVGLPVDESEPTQRRVRVA